MPPPNGIKIPNNANAFSRRQIKIYLGKDGDRSGVAVELLGSDTRGPTYNTVLSEAPYVETKDLGHQGSVLIASADTLEKGPVGVRITAGHARNPLIPTKIPAVGRGSQSGGETPSLCNYRLSLVFEGQYGK